MKTKSALSKKLGTYFNTELDLRVQFFNLLAFISIAAGIFVAVTAMLSGAQTIVAVIDLALAALVAAILLIGEKRKCYRLCSWIMIVVIFMIAFPLLFFMCGGYSGGMPCFFILGIIYTTMLLEKKEMFAALALLFVIYSSCFVVNYYHPGLIYHLPSELKYIFDVSMSFGVTAAILLLTVILRTRMFYERHDQIHELNRELAVRNETLAKYDQMKSDFLATVAHEINTPLAVIAASSNDTLDLLKESPLNMDDIARNQTVIIKRVSLIDNIIMDLMDTVAIETGRLSLNRHYICLSELLKNICDAQSGARAINNNRLVCDLQPGLANIWVDPTRIEQVMINLLSNAFQHTVDGTVTVKLSGADKKQTVSVTDNGAGMEEEMVRILFKQYVSTKADYWRHGIGLKISRQIIVAHGGEISVDSEKGRGTTIAFTINEEPGYE